MIVNAAVKIYNKEQNKTTILPCHRHSDIPEILYELNVISKWEIIQEGFLDEDGTFYDRIAALDHAIACRQVSTPIQGVKLYSEDLW